jgi:quercetin 2,3-dioxygenase
MIVLSIGKEPIAPFNLSIGFDMKTLRLAGDRGHANHGWLDSYHTFSFSSYQDPNHMGFRSLRVINDDRVDPGQGFPTHSHRDMEIITVVLEGAVAHRDSLGNVATIRPGEVQRMTAGTGITHSEFNPSETELTHLLQIWILPDQTGLTPGYEQLEFPDRLNKLCLMASPNGQDQSITIHQDVLLYGSQLETDRHVDYTIAPGRHLWIQMTGGEVTIGDQRLATGDGLAVSDEELVTIAAVTPAEFLLFDLG